ncbi:uncharacterized protein LOC124917170 [Impatiens glandulifera]|uniref:uncharacterized protein LOC124917170 n=1 Tax=Impatiens glandulifera TaxID=253017 RepID=UPI001FB17EA2|nr:uncharacterized protein LOC124917170 [Impatiens glandulifera]
MEPRDEYIQRLTSLIEIQSQLLTEFINRGGNGSGNGQGNAPPDSCGERFRRLRPPAFDGQSSDPTHAKEWIRKIENMFDYAQMEEAQKVPCAVFHLEKDASFWWESVKLTANTGGMTWGQFKTAFYDKYFSRTVKINKMSEFTQLRQTESVADYIRQFESLSRFASHLVDKEENKVYQFVQGLKLEIYKGVRTAGIDDMP